MVSRNEWSLQLRENVFSVRWQLRPNKQLITEHRANVEIQAFKCYGLLVTSRWWSAASLLLRYGEILQCVLQLSLFCCKVFWVVMRRVWSLVTDFSGFLDLWRRAVVSTVMNLRVPYHAGNFLPSRGPLSFSVDVPEIAKARMPHLICWSIAVMLLKMLLTRAQ
jgi:hypothetical protein